MKQFRFTIEVKSIGCGVVTADNLEEAKKLIAEGEWDDIYDMIDEKFGNVIDIEED